MCQFLVYYCLLRMIISGGLSLAREVSPTHTWQVLKMYVPKTHIPNQRQQTRNCQYFFNPFSTATMRLRWHASCRQLDCICVMSDSVPDLGLHVFCHVHVRFTFEAMLALRLFPILWISVTLLAPSLRDRRFLTCHLDLPISDSPFGSKFSFSPPNPTSRRSSK